MAKDEQRGAQRVDETGAPAAAQSPLRLRVLSALVLIPAAVGAIYMGSWLFLALAVAAGLVMLHEWLTISQGRADRMLLAVLGAGLVVMAGLVVLGHPDAAFVVLGVAALAAALLGPRRGANAGWTALGGLYVLVPVYALLWLREMNALGFGLTLWLLVMVWATDIGAFIVGKNLGGPLLAPRISPRKTWAGLWGGMIFSAVLGAVVGIVLGLPLAALALMLIGAAVAAWAQLGDLAESAVKRHFGVKDSGSIIPGHGGVLDRVDGLVFAAPLIAGGVALFWTAP